MRDAIRIRLAARWGYVAALLALTLFALEVDRLGHEWIAASLAWLSLTGALWASDRSERVQVIVAVVVATGFELFFAILWGLYVYRRGDLPLFVPAGHGLIYLSALRLSGTRLVGAAGFRLAAVAAAVAWTIGGLTLAATPDILGLALLPTLAWCLLRTRRGAIYAGCFVATTALELIGTRLGTWTWQAHAPLLGIGVGNPPSTIAAGYCVLDMTVLAVCDLGARLGSGRLRVRVGQMRRTGDGEPLVGEA